jgi:hypothetical protein
LAQVSSINETKQNGGICRVSNLVYDEKPKIDAWLRVLYIVPAAIPLITGIVRTSDSTREGLALFAVALFAGMLYRLLLPQRFQVFDPKLRIKLGGPFAFNIPLSDITDVKSRTGAEAFFFRGIRYATSAEHTVEIIRSEGLDVVISPENRDVFLEQLNQARHTAQSL